MPNAFRSYLNRSDTVAEIEGSDSQGLKMFIVMLNVPSCTILQCLNAYYTDIYWSYLNAYE